MDKQKFEIEKYSDWKLTYSGKDVDDVDILVFTSRKRGGADIIIGSDMTFSVIDSGGWRYFDYGEYEAIGKTMVQFKNSSQQITDGSSYHSTKIKSVASSVISLATKSKSKPRSLATSLATKSKSKSKSKSSKSKE